MISASDRENAVLLIDEAIKSGASCKKACERLEITASSDIEVRLHEIPIKKIKQN